jgi:hypothetical protein
MDGEPNHRRSGRIEAIIWTLKNQLGLERHGGRVPGGLWARIAQRRRQAAAGGVRGRLPQLR